MAKKQNIPMIVKLILSLKLFNETYRNRLIDYYSINETEDNNMNEEKPNVLPSISGNFTRSSIDGHTLETFTIEISGQSLEECYTHFIKVQQQLKLNVTYSEE